MAWVPSVVRCSIETLRGPSEGPPRLLVYFSCDPCPSVSSRHWDRAFSSPDFWCFQHKLRPGHSAICDRHRTYCLHPWTIIVTVYTFPSLIGVLVNPSICCISPMGHHGTECYLSTRPLCVQLSISDCLWTPRFTSWVSHLTSLDILIDKMKTLDH